MKKSVEIIRKECEDAFKSYWGVDRIPENYTHAHVYGEYELIKRMRFWKDSLTFSTSNFNRVECYKDSDGHSLFAVSNYEDGYISAIGDMATIRAYESNCCIDRVHFDEHRRTAYKILTDDPANMPIKVHLIYIIDPIAQLLNLTGNGYQMQSVQPPTEWDGVLRMSGKTDITDIAVNARIGYMAWLRECDDNDIVKDIMSVYKSAETSTPTLDTLLQFDRVSVDKALRDLYNVDYSSLIRYIFEN